MRIGKLVCVRNAGVRCLIFLILVLFGAWMLFSQYSPINRASAIKCTKEWARLADFPGTKSEFKIEVEGGMFTREFVVSFCDKPSNIRVWIGKCPGPSSVKPEKDGDGWDVYSYSAGGGAVFAEVRVSPSGDKVQIRSYWS